MSGPESPAFRITMLSARVKNRNLKSFSRSDRSRVGGRYHDTREKRLQMWISCNILRTKTGDGVFNTTGRRCWATATINSPDTVQLWCINAREYII
jgi:hypothetical protein